MVYKLKTTKDINFYHSFGGGLPIKIPNEEKSKSYIFFLSEKYRQLYYSFSRIVTIYSRIVTFILKPDDFFLIFQAHNKIIKAKMSGLSFRVWGEREMGKKQMLQN